MAGIYVHIPFCKQACHYCNFHFSTSLARKNEFLQALLLEISLRKQELGKEPVKTIYFGGGTPGILDSDEIGSILECIKKNYSCEQVDELSVEMNPDDVSEDKMIAYKKLGIDRISLGVQSFFEEDLLYMNRSHGAQKAIQSIEIIQQHFENFSVDLIYGFPLLTKEKLERNLDTLLSFNPPHISIYGMTVEPKTPLASFIHKGKEKDMDLDQQSAQFMYLMNRLDGGLYEHYEISSFAQKGFRAKHNSSYWNDTHYVGFGPGAHSYNGTTRQWNIANNTLYIQHLNQGTLPSEQEMLSAADTANEYVMTALRKKEGLHFDKYKNILGVMALDTMKLNALPYIENKWLEADEHGLRLTQLGKLMCDGISADLFV